MSCPACGRDNRPGARFCLDCGTVLAAPCPACDAELPPGARFCDGCGTAVASDTAGAQTRKIVTVVFADLAGSTAAQEHRDPESVRHMMDELYAALRGAVERFTGTTVKLTGDGLMAAFGVRAVAEDDAWRAVQAAVAMQHAFTALGWRDDMALRVGLNTGEVIVTEGESDVVGDAVNVAARLEAAAGAGGVLVGEETWRLTRHLARFEAVTPLTLKGKAEAVPAYRLVTLGGEVGDAPAPFVGRDAELDRLGSLFDEIERDGVVRLATVVGSPGLGKSRLALELVTRLQSRATVIEARFSATTAAATFAPVVDALRAVVGDDAIDDVVTASPQEAFLAVRRSMEALANQQPVVLVLEDLHWAEPLVLDLVEHLVEWTQNAPVLLLALARPELRETRPALVDVAGRAALVTVLEGLDPVESERLACDLLETDELPPALLTRILAGSEGNPLFVRELVRMLVDDGVIRRHGDEWRPTIEVDAITVPPTIQSLLAARVERLPADERTVLECAAVVGREFYRGAVAALVPGPVRGQLDVILERLRQKEMVEPEGAYWIDEPVLRFHHVLLRDAAYRRLLKEVRAELHERYARWLEAKAGGGDNDEVLGFHLEQAHQYRVELGRFDDHTAVLGHRAAERLAAAGRRALDRDDLPAAAGLLGRALDRMDGDDPGRSGLLIDRCEALVTTGALADGALAVAELETLAAGSPRLRAWASCFVAQLAILTDPGQLQETAALAERAAADLAKLTDAAGTAKAHAVHASALARLGRVAETEAALDRALAAAREAGDTRRATAVLAGAPLAALWGPSPVARASGRCLDVVRVLRITTSATTVEATSLRCQAVLEALRGRTDAARRMLASARRSLEELGHRHGLLSTEMFAGLVELLAGDPTAAERALQRAHDGFLELGAGADAGQAAALLARAVMAQGRAAEAQQLTMESEQLGGADLKTAIAWRAVRAEALARRGAIDEALALARAAVALAEPTDALLDQADTHLAMATTLQLAGRAEEAGASARRAVDLYERKGATVPAERARRLLVSPAPATPSDAGQPLRRVVRPNTATRACAAAEHAFDAHDLDAYLALFGPDAVVVDHVHSAGRTEHAYRDWADHLPDGRLVIEVLLTLGERHALVRTVSPITSRMAGPAEIEDLRAMRVGEDGRFTRQERFRPDDLHLALARFLELHAENELHGADQAASIRLAQTCRLVCPGGWDRILEESYGDQVSFVDHRTVVNMGVVRGRDAVLSAFAQMREVAGPTDARLLDVLAATPMCGLLELAVESRPPGTFEFRFLTLVTAGPDGLLQHNEWWELNQIDAAHARFEELTAGTPDEDVWPASKVLRTLGTFAELYRTDWPAAETLLAPDIRVEDRRAGLQSTAEGEAALENFRLIASVVEYVQYEPVATRGDRLSLARITLRGASPAFEAVTLQLHECDEHGLLTLNIAFDPQDVDAAYDELDERFAASGIDPEAWALASRFRDAYRTRDRDAFAATLHPAFHVVDHRPAGWGEVGADAFQELSLSLLQMAANTQMELWAVPALTSRGMAIGVTMAGTTEDGAPFEMPRAMVALFREGAIERFETFPANQLDVAVSRLEELTAEPASSGGPRETAAGRAMEQFFHCWFAHDWDRVRSLIAPDIENDDRRAALGVHITDPDTYLENLRNAVGIGLTNADATALATRGEEHQLVRVVFHGRTPDGDRSEVELLNVNRFDAEGRVRYSSNFEPADLAAAIEHLDERFALSLPEQEAAAFAVGRRLVRSYNERAWEEHFGLLADDFRSVDHRPAGQPPVGRDDFERLVRGLVDVAHDARIEIIEVPAVTAHGLVAVTTLRAAGELAGPSEVHRTQLVGVRDGRITHFENWNVEDVDAAIVRLHEVTARFEQVTRREDGTAIPSNAASRLVERFNELFEARQWSELTALVSDDFEMEDRRRATRNVVRGRDAFIANNRQMTAVSRRRMTLVATRGERIALVRSVWHGELDSHGPFEVETLDLCELDDRGQGASFVIFDPNDLDAAFAELDRSFRAGATEAARESIRIGDSLLEAFAARDWSFFERVLAQDLVVVDHRDLGFEPRSRADYLSTTRALLDLAPDMRSRNLCQPRATEAGAVALWQFSGTYGDGTRFERPFVILSFMRDGVIHHMETFPAEELDAAVAHFDELTGSGSGLPHNHASMVTYRSADLLVRHDWDGLRALFEVDAVFEDRRPGLTAVVRGDGAITEMYRAMESVKGADRVIVATRGDRVFLGNITWRGEVRDAPFEVEHLAVVQVGESGRISLMVSLEPHDLDAAFAELDRRFREGEGAAFASSLDRGYEFMTAHAAADWEALAATLHPELEVLDRRRTGFPPRRKSEYVEAIRTLDEQTQLDETRVLAVPRVATRGHLFLACQRGTWEGTEFERLFAVVSTLEDSLLRRLEYFPGEELDRAIARFDEVSAEGPRPAEGTSSTSATQLAERFTTRFLAREWDRLGDVFAEDCVIDDRRPGSLSTVRGRSACVANLRNMAGIHDRTVEILATRGEDLVLLRSVWHGELPDTGLFEVETLDLGQGDANGRTQTYVLFDPADLDQAFRELDRRFADQLDLRSGQTWEASRRYGELFNQRAWEEIAELAAPDYVLNDHRPAGWGTIDMAGYLQMGRGLVEMAPDARWSYLAVPRIGPGSLCTLLRVSGTNADGGAFEIDILTAGTVVDGKLREGNLYGADDWSSALARFDELLAEVTWTDSPIPENVASRLGRRVVDRVVAHDEAGYLACHEPDVVQEDLRPGFRSVIIGHDGHREQIRAMAAVRDANVRVLATRGERNALFSALWSGEDRNGARFEIETLQIADLAPSGRLARGYLFAPDDLDAATELLDARFAEGEAADSRSAWQVMRDVIAAYNSGDRELFVAQARDVSSVVDHQVLGQGELTGEQLRLVSSVGDGGDARMTCLAVPRIGPHGIVAVLRTAGTVPLGGGDGEVVFVVVGSIDGDHANRLEFFDPEHLDDAIARYDELTAVTPNQAWAVSEQVIESWLAHDWEKHAALYAADATWEDRRPGLQTSLRGRHQITALSKAVGAVTTTMRTLLATRGERLSLGHAVLIGQDRRGGDFEVETLQVVEIDDVDRVIAIVQLDPSDLAAAHEELDRRFAAGDDSTSRLLDTDPR